MAPKMKAMKAIRPIRSDLGHAAALVEIERYFDHEPKPGTAAADRFDLLALVIEDYERKRWPIDAPDPVDAVRWRMETGGFTQADLGRLIGSRQRASDILSRRRRLTMQMAWKLHRAWDIPAEALIRPPVRRTTRAQSTAAE
jgi:HTH-type transcriptional regulator/antitoxin HigA